MNSLKERKDDIINFWDIEEESAQEELINEIRQYAESKKEEELAPEIRANFDQMNLSGIGVIYEALSKNPKKWSNFFKEEYLRAFESAEQSDNAFEILESLEEIGFVDENKLESRDEIITFLEGYLSHKNDAIRYKAIWYLGDWISDDNKTKYTYIIQKIINKLNDSNWKIRYVTKLILEGMNKLPKDFTLSFSDKMRIKFLSPFQIK